MSVRTGWGAAVAGVVVLAGAWLAPRLRAPLAVAFELIWPAWAQDVAVEVGQAVLSALGWG